MLHIHRAERADGLVDVLASLLAQPLDDAMAREVVAIPTRGIERWLAQRLSGRLGVSPGRADGVCANIDFPFPGPLVGGAVAAASGIEPGRDPWVAERAAWPLLDVVDGCLSEPWMAPLRAHLCGTDGAAAAESRRARRFATVRHLADLYDRYGVHRPEMLRSWAVGHDVDGSGCPLAADLAWQAELWRRLRRRMPVASPAERMGEACATLARGSVAVDLPPRLSLFGLTRLPVSYLEVLAALSNQRDVHLFLLHPSPVLWSRVAEVLDGRPRPVRRAHDRTADLPRNPLLASWGRDAREMQLLLTGAGVAMTDDHRAIGLEPTTLLGRIQADVRADRSPPGPPLPGELDRRPLLDPDDRSLQIHACHGRSRQVEVVRDAILHLLTNDPSLEARDIIVMCPDIETFAPLILATFGAGDADPDRDSNDTPAAILPTGDGPPHAGHRAPNLRVRLADRSLRQTNPILAVVSELLRLADARLTSTQVLDLASREPIRSRFGLDDDDLTRIHEWVAASGVRWGFDAAHRQRFKLDQLEANTWRAGLDRVLLGVAMAEEGHRLVSGVLPIDDVDSGDIDLAGRFTEFIDRLQNALDRLGGPQPLEAWVASLSTSVASLTATDTPDAWQGIELQKLLDGLATEAEFDDQVSATPLTLSEIRSLLSNRLRGRPTRANFRTGHLTICTLVPMRSVPHRAVCLLGLDDGMFPRQPARDGDDLVAADLHVGDRDIRSEDHQLLLDAVLSATDALIITYAGRNERTNSLLPPAVPVGELLDVVDATVQTGALASVPMNNAGATTNAGATVQNGGQGSSPARYQVVVRHPLQPFDVRNFMGDALVRGDVWSFDRINLAGAQALISERTPAPPFLAGPLPSVAGRVIELEQLVRFVQHPVRAFLRQRLGITLGARFVEVSSTFPVEVAPLDQWSLGQRLLDGRLSGASADTCLRTEIARGLLPPGELVHPVIDEVLATVERIVAAAETLAPGTDLPASVEVNLTLPDGRILVGSVPGVTGAVVRSVNFGRVSVRHRLGAWVRLLAVSAAQPGVGFGAVTVGRARAEANRSARVTIARIAPLADTGGADDAGAPNATDPLASSLLMTLVDLYDRSQREPPPLYCATSAAYAQAVAAGKDPTQAATKAWTSAYNYPKEDVDPEHRLVLGGVRTFAELLDTSRGNDETEDSWAVEDSRFGSYARRLWDGLLTREDVVDR